MQHNNKKIVLVAALFGCFAPLLFSAPLAQAAKLDLGTYLEQVELTSPDARAEKQSLKYSEIAVENVGIFPDPQIQIGRERELVPMVNDMGEKSASSPAWVVGLSQEFPWFGTRDAKVAALNADIPLAELQVKAAATERKYLALQNFIEMGTINSNIELDQESLIETEKILELLHKRSEQGFVNHANVFQIQIEIELIRAEIISLQNDLDIRVLRAKTFAGITDTNLTFDFKLPPNLINLNIIAQPKSETKQDISEQLFMKELDKKIATFAAARAGNYPSLMGSLTLMREDSGMYMFNAMLGMRVPLSAPKIDSTLLSLTMASETSINLQKESYDFKKKEALILANKRIAQAIVNIKIIQDKLLPLANDHQKVLLSDFSQGKAALADLTLSRKNMLRYKVALAKAFESLATERIQLERLTAGIGLDSLYRSAPTLALGGMGESNAMSSNSAMPQNSPMPSSRGAAGKKQRSTPPQIPSGAEDSDTGGGSSGGGMGM